MPEILAASSVRAKRSLRSICFSCSGFETRPCLGSQAQLGNRKNGLSGLRKFLRGNPGLFQDGSQSSLRKGSGMMGDGGVSIAAGVIPDFMTAGGLAIKSKPKLL